jgi:probable rRNA maturation factor
MKIRRTAQAILNALDCPEGELSVLIVDDAQISKLNKEYLHREGPTNVIAFPMREGPFSEITPGLLGDVVISVDTARKEALDADLSLEERLVQLLIHGILHLFGYDHEMGGERAREMADKSNALTRLDAIKKIWQR